MFSTKLPYLASEQNHATVVAGKEVSLRKGRVECPVGRWSLTSLPSRSVYSGHQSVLVPPLELESNVSLWLSAVSQYKARVTFCSYSVMEMCTKGLGAQTGVLRVSAQTRASECAVDHSPGKFKNNKTKQDSQGPSLQLEEVEKNLSHYGPCVHIPPPRLTCLCSSTPRRRGGCGRRAGSLRDGRVEVWLCGRAGVGCRSDGIL